MTAPNAPVPAFLYGTAWKEDRTEELVRLALATGFRGIDTANQRRHYVEAAVGAAVAAVLGDGTVTRADLFLQTKFTSVDGQDQRLPYDPQAEPAKDWAVWQAMEALHHSGQARRLGVSNVSLEQLTTLHQGSRVKPASVQNRCFAIHGWDRDVRAFCARQGIVYQGFSLLTANARELGSPAVVRAARRTGRTPAQVVFRFALQVGMLPLTGSSSPAHLQEDLACFDFELEPAEVRAIEECGV